jgi:hypothetical protein
MWNVYRKIRPVMTGTTVAVTEVLKKHLEAILGKYSVESLQKIAILRTNHTQYGKYCSLKLEAWAVGITVGSRG